MSESPKVAVIGAGNWGMNHVRVFHRLGALGAVVDASEETRGFVEEKYGDVPVYADYRAVLADPAIAGVVVATPVPTHYSIAADALRAGKDVLVEKPLTRSVEEAEVLLGLAKASDRVLMVGHLLLFKPAVQKLIESIKSGLIGDLCYIEMRRTKLGRVRRQENVLWSFATHDIAVLLEMVGELPQSIWAGGQAVIQPQVEDNVHLSLMFFKEIQAHIQVSWLWPEDERRTVVVGSEGMLTYDEHEDRLWLHEKGVNGDLEVWEKELKELPFEKGDALEGEARHFLYCIKERKQPLASGNKGLEVVKILKEAGEAMKKWKKSHSDNLANEYEKEYFVHESAFIDEGVKIGKGTQIWHFCHVMPEAEIGERCKLGQNVFVGRKVRIGNNVKIQNNVSVYQGVTLEDDVFCGPSMVFTNDLNPRSVYPKGADNYVPTLVKKGASLGANATVLCGVTIGENAFIGAGAVVTKDVPDHAVVKGNPAKVSGWACECGRIFRNKNQLSLCGCSTG